MRCIRTRVLGPICAVVLLAVACGGSDGTSLATGAQADVPTSFEDIDYQSPLSDFLGQDVGQFDFDEAEMIEQQRESERATAACMAEAGFEYIPQDMSEMMSFGSPFQGEFEPGSDEWIDKYGFGISTMRFPQSMVGDLVGMDDEGFMGPDQEFVDPNREYVEALSEGEREAYQEALFGLPPDFGSEGPSEEDMFDFQPSGCQFEGFQDGPFGADSTVSEFYRAFGPEVQALNERIDADSRVVAFNTEISECVAEEGMDWTGMQDLYEQFEPRLNKLQPQAFMSGDPFEAAGLDPEEMSEQELNDFFNEMNRLDPEQLVLLGEIQADEIALAKAVKSCGGGPIAELIVRNEVQVEYEQAFLDENAEALAEFAPAE